jgi:hypothetical protein
MAKGIPTFAMGRETQNRMVWKNKKTTRKVEQLVKVRFSPMSRISFHGFDSSLERIRPKKPRIFGEFRMALAKKTKKTRYLAGKAGDKKSKTCVKLEKTRFFYGAFFS